MIFDLWQPLAGLALFLLAMSMIEESIRRLAGARVRTFIANNTQHPVRGVLSGTVATALLQSSSLVGLLVLAFVGARTMRLRDALLVIFGANLGTTATGWIVATLGFKLDLAAVSLPLVASGGLLWAMSGARRASFYGKLLLGLGILLLGLEYMKASAETAQALVDIDQLKQLGLLEFLLFGTLFSAVVQSSSATMVVTLSALNAGIIDLTDAAAVVIGADLGTTSTVVLGALRGSSDKRRVALGHVLFNVATDALAFGLLIPLVSFVSMMDDPLMSLVAFHSAFNLLGVFIWTPWVNQFAAFLQRSFRAGDRAISQYLDEAMQQVPADSLPALEQELDELRQRVMTHNADLFAHFDQATFDRHVAVFRREYARSKQLEGEILQYALEQDLKAYDEHQRDQLESVLRRVRGLLLSAKLQQDSLNNLQSLAMAHTELCHRICEAQSGFYRLLQQWADGGGAQTQFATLIAEREEIHERIHQIIYGDIRAGHVPAADISAVLNINRLLYHANLALINALSPDESAATAAASLEFA